MTQKYMSGHYTGQEGSSLTGDIVMIWYERATSKGSFLYKQGWVEVHHFVKHLLNDIIIIP